MAKGWMCFLALFCLQAGLASSKDYEYVLLFLENYVEEVNTQEEVELYIASRSNATVQVTISNPNGNFLNPQSYSIDASTVKNVSVSQFVRQTDELNYKAITVVSNGDIIVYALNRNRYSTDGFTAFSVDHVGKEYYAMAYTAEYNTQIGLVAVEDGTTNVTVTLPTSASVRWFGTLYNGGESISFSLDKYQSARIESDSGDLTGAKIESSQKISAFSGNVRTKVDGNSRDHLVDQLPPLIQWGFTYYTVRTPGRTPDRPDVVRIVAHEDGTKVEVKGDINDFFTLNSGEYRELLAYAPLYINSGNNSVMVGVISSSQSPDVQYKDIDEGDPSLIVMPAAGQYSADYVFSTPLYIKPPSSSSDQYDIYVLVIVKTLEVDGLSLNTQPVSTNWSVIAGTNYSSGQIAVLNGETYRLQHSNSDARFMALLYGSADKESFYFPIAVGMANINVVTPVEIEGNQGEKGAKGAQGTAGAVGSKGPQGSRGDAGVAGSTGTKGAPGDEGFAGLNSAFGATGATGVAGSTGATGVPGSMGLTGSTGVTGTKGPSGAQGPTGAQGVSGSAESPGSPGAPGEVGVSGTSGSVGQKGDMGVSGVKGVPGPTGREGPKGFVAGGSCDDKCSVRGTPQPATCQVTYGDYSYICSCPPGFHLVDSNPNVCMDIDECELGLCSHGCTNSIGSYTCSCPKGYQLIQNNCIDVDECSSANNPCGSAVCVNGIGGHLCLSATAPEPQLSREGLRSLISRDLFITLLCLLVLLTILVIITAMCLLHRHRMHHKPEKPGAHYVYDQTQTYTEPTVYMQNGYYR